LDNATFQRFASVLKAHSGMVLRPGQAYHLEARLMPLAKVRNLPLVALADLATVDPAVARTIAEEAAIHETSFFRGTNHFDLLRKEILPAVVRHNAGRRRLRLWSAACATGQEVWSLAMLIRGELSGLLAGWQVDIVGTDFSTFAIARAESGEYTDFEVRRGLGPSHLDRWFTRDGNLWRVRESLRQGVRFVQANLLEDQPDLGSHDIVLCRHVLIYFDDEAKARALSNIRRRLDDHGALILGGVESAIGFGDLFRLSPRWSGAFEPDGAAWTPKRTSVAAIHLR